MADGPPSLGFLLGTRPRLCGPRFRRLLCLRVHRRVKKNKNHDRAKRWCPLRNTTGKMLLIAPCVRQAPIFILFRMCDIFPCRQQHRDRIVIRSDRVPGPCLAYLKAIDLPLFPTYTHTLRYPPPPRRYFPDANCRWHIYGCI